MTTNSDPDDDDDPFACFDDSDDDDDDDGSENTTGPSREPIRDPENGVLAFHSGTEVALLHFVRTKQLSKETKRNKDLQELSIAQSEGLLECIDSYCISRHWMMHVGPEKAGPLKEFLWKSLLRHFDNKTPSTRFHFVELGTYCGYSSIFFAKTILEYYQTKGSEAAFHIYSFEVVPGFASVARELIGLAGMEDYITVVLIPDHDDVAPGTTVEGSESKGSVLSTELQRRLVSSAHNDDAFIDFLFVDHDKSLYLPNLIELEANGFLREGTHVAADNVVFAQIDDYREYMGKQAREGVVTTRLEDSLCVEYCQPELDAMQTAISDKEAIELRDGIEFSIYLRDPIGQATSS